MWRSSGERNSYPLQYSCLENPWTEEPGRLHGVAKNQMGLSNKTATTKCFFLFYFCCYLFGFLYNEAVMHRIIWFPKAKNGLFFCVFLCFFCQIAKLEYVFVNKIYYFKKKIKLNLWYNEDICFWQWFKIFKK